MEADMSNKYSQLTRQIEKLKSLTKELMKEIDKQRDYQAQDTKRYTYVHMSAYFTVHTYILC